MRHGVTAATTCGVRNSPPQNATVGGTGVVASSRMQPRVAQSGLVLVPPQALTAPETSLAYVRGALVSPVCISAAVFAACVGVGIAGALGAIVAIMTIAMLGASSTRYGFVKRHLDRQSRARERCARESARIKKLRPTGPVRLQQYLELRALVEEIERTDAPEAARFELQDLLEHFVALSVSQQRCLDALRLVGSHDLPQNIPAVTDSNRSKRRREIQQRRLRHREECLTRIDRLADEIEAVDELIRLVAQRVACPPAEAELDREIDRRLWELDEVDAALSQLSA